MGDGACDADDLGEGASAEPEAFHGFGDELSRCGVERRDLGQLPRGKGGVARGAGDARGAPRSGPGARPRPGRARSLTTRPRRRRRGNARRREAGRRGRRSDREGDPRGVRDRNGVPSASSDTAAPDVRGYRKDSGSLRRRPGRVQETTREPLHARCTRARLRAVVARLRGRRDGTRAARRGTHAVVREAHLAGARELAAADEPCSLTE